MVKPTRGRVAITKNIEEMLDLAAKIYAKHQEDGADSYLHHLEGANWNEIGPIIPEVLANHQQAESLKAQAEERYRMRDAKFKLVMDLILSTKNLLKGKYAKNPKTLSNWGFNVDDTPKVKKKREKK
ncbi:MAG: hypothetical protein SFU99_20185 [Saprospiraceae bacterium]|nr:hypothetical protein [Saprospiraceae bacterium]